MSQFSASTGWQRWQPVLLPREPQGAAHTMEIGKIFDASSRFLAKQVRDDKSKEQIHAACAICRLSAPLRRSWAGCAGTDRYSGAVR